MIKRIVESSNHYEPIKDFRIKNMKNSEHKAFWTQMYKIYKDTIRANKPLVRILPSNPYVIKFITKPSYDEQMAAVLSEPKTLKYIKNADPYVQLRAIKVDPYLIKHVKDPTEEMWVWAIDLTPSMIMKNPKPNWFMIKLAQERNVRGLNNHKGLTDEMKSYLALVA